MGERTKGEYKIVITIEQIVFCFDPFAGQTNPDRLLVKISFRSQSTRLHSTNIFGERARATVLIPNVPIRIIAFCPNLSDECSLASSIKT